MGKTGKKEKKEKKEMTIQQIRTAGVNGIVFFYCSFTMGSIGSNKKLF